MGTSNLWFSKLYTLLFLVTLLFNEIQSLQNKPNPTVPAIFVFGDSTVDPGNNNYIPTIFKSNFPPYGRDLRDHRPTGRFCNGKLATDIIASYFGIKEEIPPYLNETLSMEELLTGVSFASAGSGYDPFTAEITEVLPMSKQLDYFKQYVKRIEGFLGQERAQESLHRAISVLSCGTNDFVNDYYLVPQRRRSFSLEGYQAFLLQQVRDLVQAWIYEHFPVERPAPDLKYNPAHPRAMRWRSTASSISAAQAPNRLKHIRHLLDTLIKENGIYNLGARKIVIVGLPPMGCLPIVITLNSRGKIFDRECVTNLNLVAQDYNQKLQNALHVIQQSVEKKGGKINIMYGDIYNPILDMILTPDRFGFEETMTGCCGTGLFEASFACNDMSPVCFDASKYVFWDAIHPTESAYRVIADSLFESLEKLLIS